jgi:methylated-DNA-[protein]-cysteine S-methyltransferase
MDAAFVSLDRYTTPIGVFLLATDEAGHVRAIDLDGDEARMTRHLHRHGGTAIRWGAAPAALRASLQAYFAGDLKTLDDISCAPDGTPFQQSVWTALRSIPAGHTESYGRLAERLGNPKAVRAVGLANGSNPIPLIIPCHRVIGADGSLTGYGGGLERKRWLLAHEGRHSPLFAQPEGRME